MSFPISETPIYIIKKINVNLTPNYRLAGDPLELPHGPMGEPGNPPLGTRGLHTCGH